MGEYWWFCLEHVRAYNASWDFYKGMSAAQIELQMRADTAWQRPTWPLGTLGGRLDDEVLRDPLGALHAGLGNRRNAAPPPSTVAPAELRQPLADLGLAWPVAIDTLKARYKALAKEHHPDRHGGDPAAEERLKTINLAYSAVQLPHSGHPAARRHRLSAERTSRFARSSGRGYHRRSRAHDRIAGL